MSLVDSLLAEDILGRSSRQAADQPISIAKREVFIAIRRDGIPGDGTARNPYNGSSRLQLDRILNGDFDTTLRSPVRFILGPGIFRTAGCARTSATVENTDGWVGRVLPGQEFVGAGMFATTLRLEIPEPLENAGYGVFGQLVVGDDILIQDMTVDCDMQNQKRTGSYGYSRIMTNLGGVVGKRNRIKRVRVINSGTRTPGFEFGYKPPEGQGLANGQECFPIGMISGSWGDLVDIVVEDCIIEQPFHSNGRVRSKKEEGNRVTIENNIIDSPSSTPNHAVRVTDCVSTHIFNNRRINGDLARVVNTNTGLYVPELTTDAEDVLLSL